MKINILGCALYSAVVAIAVLFFVSLVGCGSKPPASIISNEQANEITEREKLVEAFGTAEVVGIPSDSHEFLVRDTNGLVWYVSTRTGTQGLTRMFGWHEEFPKPVPPPSVTVTNTVYRTNSVSTTNYVVEDPSTNR